MNLRKITSLTAMISFALLILSSIVLYILPSGRVAYWSGYTLWGLNKEDWGAVHINLGVLLLISMILHLYYNWTPLISYMKDRSKHLRIFTINFNISLVISLIVFFGTLAGIPPMSSIIHLGEAITDNANHKYGEPPYGHAEMSSLNNFVKKVGIDLESSLAALEAAEIKVDSPASTMKEIARANAITPQQIFDTINLKGNSRGGKGHSASMPATPPGGTGRRTLKQICSLYKLDEHTIITGLKAAGIDAEIDQTMKEIAGTNNMDPHSVYAMIYKLQK